MGAYVNSTKQLPYLADKKAGGYFQNAKVWERYLPAGTSILPADFKNKAFNTGYSGNSSYSNPIDLKHANNQVVVNKTIPLPYSIDKIHNGIQVVYSNPPTAHYNWNSQYGFEFINANPFQGLFGREDMNYPKSATIPKSQLQVGNSILIFNPATFDAGLYSGGAYSHYYGKVSLKVIDEKTLTFNSEFISGGSTEGAARNNDTFVVNDDYSSQSDYYLKIADIVTT